MKSLVRKKDFRSLVEEGKKLKPSSWLVINYLKNDVGHLRFGWTATSKMGTAVIRNKMRRWSREFFRDKTEVCVDINLLFLAQRKPGFYKELKHEELDKILISAWTKIRQNL